MYKIQLTGDLISLVVWAQHTKAFQTIEIDLNPEEEFGKVRHMIVAKGFIDHHRAFSETEVEVNLERLFLEERNVLNVKNKPRIQVNVHEEERVISIKGV